MKHVKKIDIIQDTTGNIINRITTSRGIVIELESMKYPGIEEKIEEVEILSQAIEQIIKNILQNAVITLDPKTNNITITFK